MISNQGVNLPLMGFSKLFLSLSVKADNCEVSASLLNLDLKLDQFARKVISILICCLTGSTFWFPARSIYLVYYFFTGVKMFFPILAVCSKMLCTLKVQTMYFGTVLQVRGQMTNGCMRNKAFKNWYYLLQILEWTEFTLFYWILTGNVLTQKCLYNSCCQQFIV